MKRYDIYIGQDRSGDPVMERDELPNGDWVDFEDVAAEMDALRSILMACLSPIEDEFPVTEKLLTDCIKSILNGEPAQEAVRKYLLAKGEQQ